MVPLAFGQRQSNYTLTFLKNFVKIFGFKKQLLLKTQKIERGLNNFF